MLNSPRCWVDCRGPRKPFPYLHLPVKKYGMCQIYLLYRLTLLPRVTVARWVSESMRPFRIVKDRGLRWLCKTGRPHFYLPDETTVAKDVKFLHNWSERHLAEELQVNPLKSHLDLTTLNLQQTYPGNLAYQLDCWTSPNH